MYLNNCLFVAALPAHGTVVFGWEGELDLRLLGQVLADGGADGRVAVHDVRLALVAWYRHDVVLGVGLQAPGRGVGVNGLLICSLFYISKTCLMFNIDYWRVQFEEKNNMQQHHCKHFTRKLRWWVYIFFLYCW